MFNCFINRKFVHEAGLLHPQGQRYRSHLRNICPASYLFPPPHTQLKSASSRQGPLNKTLLVLGFLCLAPPSTSGRFELRLLLMMLLRSYYAASRLPRHEPHFLVMVTSCGEAHWVRLELFPWDLNTPVQRCHALPPGVASWNGAAGTIFVHTQFPHRVRKAHFQLQTQK